MATKIYKVRISKVETETTKAEAMFDFRKESHEADTIGRVRHIEVNYKVSIFELDMLDINKHINKRAAELQEVCRQYPELNFNIEYIKVALNDIIATEVDSYEVDETEFSIEDKDAIGSSSEVYVVVNIGMKGSRCIGVASYYRKAEDNEVIYKPLYTHQEIAFTEVENFINPQ